MNILHHRRVRSVLVDLTGVREEIGSKFANNVNQKKIIIIVLKEMFKKRISG